MNEARIRRLCLNEDKLRTIHSEVSTTEFFDYYLKDVKSLKTLSVAVEAELLPLSTTERIPTLLRSWQADIFEYFISDLGGQYSSEIATKCPQATLLVEVEGYPDEHNAAWVCALTVLYVYVFGSGKNGTRYYLSSNAA